MVSIVSNPSKRISATWPWFKERLATSLVVAVLSRPVPGWELVAAIPVRKVLRFLTGLLLGLISGLALLTAAALLPRAFGYTPLVVVSGSMEPTLHTGDVAVTRPVMPYDLQIGDVATYRSELGLITHRIVGLDITPQGHFFQMKGDANLTADPWVIPTERMVSKVVYRIPRVGFLVTAAASPVGTLFLIVAPLLFLAWMLVKGRLTVPTAQPALSAYAIDADNRVRSRTPTLNSHARPARSFGYAPVASADGSAHRSPVRALRHHSDEGFDGQTGERPNPQ